MMSVAIIILGAGASVRLGQSKQLLKVNGEFLLRKTALAALQSAADKTLVVLGANSHAHQNIIEDLSLEIAINNEWQKGMGASLKLGLRTLLSQAEKPEAVIVAVCDQPYLNSSVFNEIIKLHFNHPDQIIACSYMKVTGVPVLFPAKWFNELLSIANEAGARQIIHKNKDQVLTFPFEEGSIDIDTPEDLKKLY
ncbi:MAG TPA: nucleotidyltransferase family protein [Cyclobacteriaceae bacterium]|nr:nucleotidyltransferase family protein [Cyclobacteriaceae bacterium]